MYVRQVYMYDRCVSPVLQGCVVPRRENKRQPILAVECAAEPHPRRAVCSRAAPPLHSGGYTAEPR